MCVAVHCVWGSGPLSLSIVQGLSLYPLAVAHIDPSLKDNFPTLAANLTGIRTKEQKVAGLRLRWEDEAGDHSRLLRASYAVLIRASYSVTGARGRPAGSAET